VPPSRSDEGASWFDGKEMRGETELGSKTAAAAGTHQCDNVEEQRMGMAGGGKRLIAVWIAEEVAENVETRGLLE